MLGFLVCTLHRPRDRLITWPIFRPRDARVWNGSVLLVAPMAMSCNRHWQANQRPTKHWRRPLHRKILYGVLRKKEMHHYRCDCCRCVCVMMLFSCFYVVVERHRSISIVDSISQTTCIRSDAWQLLAVEINKDVHGRRWTEGAVFFHKLLLSEADSIL